ncbi:MAG: DEAD/DEAH box helicase [bacterium]
MPVVIPFSQCKARPEEGGQHFLLESHLLAVARGWGKADGSYEERLFFLGGLCHDAAKGRKKWQNNLNNPKGSRPPHAAPSALLFSYYAAKLLEFWEEQERLDRKEIQVLRVFIVRVVRDIFDHHRELGDMEEEVPWLYMPDKDLSLHDLDLTGFHGFICQYVPIFTQYDKPMLQTITEWNESLKKKWPRWSNVSRIIPKLCSRSALSRIDVEKGLCVRNDTARFISADRTNAAQIPLVYLEPESAQTAITRFDAYCRERAEMQRRDNPDTQEIINKREIAQVQSLERYRGHSMERFYALSLPTGLGKTLTSLRIALEACKIKRCHRIIYAAPYISILSQATSEIRNATELEILQHHHLSMLSEDDFDDKDILIIESWQAPVVTTTFNQLFRALFPYRAQELVRMPAMEKAFIIIDEPQIIDSTKWNLFLAQIYAAAQKLNCQVMFISATLPPFEYAGIKTPYIIKPSVTLPSRYCMRYLPEKFSEADLAIAIFEALPQNVCAVMNTVRDACEVYTRLKQIMQNSTLELGILDNMEWFLKSTIKDFKHHFIFNLNGLMTPIHKEFVINAISLCLQQNMTTAVVCTQMIEAGVDLSFDSGIRAQAIHPSHIQFAGRNNRHGEGDTALVSIINFFREGKKDSRKWVYTSSVEREETDRLLRCCHEWDEATSLMMLDMYYRSTFERNPNTTLLNYYNNAALGKWSMLAGIEPFDNWYPTLSAFVPWPDTKILNRLYEWYQKHLPGKINTVGRIIRLMTKFEIESVEDIYEKYVDWEFRKSLDFVQRKQFIALLQQFLVSVSENMRSLTYQTNDNPIRGLIDKELYSTETGLAHHVGCENQGLYW